MKKKTWTHKKQKGEWFGCYQWLEGERVFTLYNGKRGITFESWQQAKALGWINK
jgi:hypothetical protein